MSSASLSRNSPSHIHMNQVAQKTTVYLPVCYTGIKCCFQGQKNFCSLPSLPSASVTPRLYRNLPRCFFVLLTSYWAKLSTFQCPAFSACPLWDAVRYSQPPGLSQQERVCFGGNTCRSGVLLLFLPVLFCLVFIVLFFLFQIKILFLKGCVCGVCRYLWVP